MSPDRQVIQRAPSVQQRRSECTRHIPLTAPLTAFEQATEPMMDAPHEEIPRPRDPP